MSQWELNQALKRACGQNGFCYLCWTKGLKLLLG